MHPYRPMLLFALAFVALPLQAREVYRCRTADGALRFGDTPCPAGSLERANVTLPDPPAEQRRKDDDAAERRARAYAETDSRRIAELEAEAARRLPPSLGGAARPAAVRVRERPARPDPKERACAAVKAKRDKAYRERGNSMGFDERRRLQDQKIDACGL